jgi:hypothetical protein
MQMQSINVSNLVMDRPTEEAGFNKDNLAELAKSIEANGLLHPPSVIPIAGRDGFFKVIAGRNRVYSCGKILGWKEVECNVVDLTEAEDIESLQLAENIFRKATTQEQRLKGIIRWREIYTTRHPGSDGRGSAQAIKKVEKANKLAGQDSQSEAGLPTKTFKKTIEDTLEVSPRTATKLARVGRTLTEEDATVLAANGVTNETVDQICALGTHEAVQTAVKLIGSGMDHKEAVAQAEKLKPAKPKKEKKPKPGDELTDDAWVMQYCSSLLCNLKHRQSARNDAILYRQFHEVIQDFRNKVKRKLDALKDRNGNNGEFFYALQKLMRISHPMHWMVCGSCGGTGKSDDGKSCGRCFGSAYKARLEDF